MLEVFEIGSAVEFVSGQGTATVSGISIRQTGVTYECVWWDGGSRKQEWVHSFEIRSASECDKKIGFLRDSK